ncbi:hypothetical protein FE697_020675 [Mumia zhuanghuii]|uniref:Uncharacterized protein n=2 Tax=Mumia TaxID=1546255 RepID=A0ABW1QL77_9ACTN|nr:MULTISPECIES: hypothetical protein [Mumia]KAA1418248.1 hypothetical protein FE697_020675 [Mumia zhuanghuii]
MSNSWWEALQAIGLFLSPFAVAWLAYVLSIRQSRNDELKRVQLEYYSALAPRLNTLVCYVTFMGDWRDISPPEVIALKRQLDREFFVAAPLFSPRVRQRYDAFLDDCYRTFGEWGTDPKVRSSALPRREVWRGEWDSSWDAMFEFGDVPLTTEMIRKPRRSHDELIAALVTDLKVVRSRPNYTSDLVALERSSLGHAERDPVPPGAA